MTTDREALQASWNRTRKHLGAAQGHLTSLPNIDVSRVLHYLDHNELGLAFDCLVYLGDDLDLPLTFWQHLDRAAREMGMYSVTRDDQPLYFRAASLCRSHLDPSEKE